MGYTIPRSYRHCHGRSPGRHIGVQIALADADVACPDADHRKGAGGDELARLLLRHAERCSDTSGVEEWVPIQRVGARDRGRPHLEPERLELGGDLGRLERVNSSGELAELGAEVHHVRFTISSHTSA
jgi:hypothetical protein